MMTKEQVIRLAAERAQLLFVAEGWTWTDGMRSSVPLIDEIERTYRRLILDVGKSRAETGRLIVERTDLGLSLSVEVGNLFGDEDEHISPNAREVQATKPPARKCMWAVEGECGPQGCTDCEHGGAGSPSEAI